MFCLSPWVAILLGAPPAEIDYNLSSLLLSLGDIMDRYRRRYHSGKTCSSKLLRLCSIFRRLPPIKFVCFVIEKRLGLSPDDKEAGSDWFGVVLRVCLLGPILGPLPLLLIPAHSHPVQTNRPFVRSPRRENDLVGAIGWIEKRNLESINQWRTPNGAVSAGFVADVHMWPDKEARLSVDWIRLKFRTTKCETTEHEASASP